VTGDTFWPATFSPRTNLNRLRLVRRLADPRIPTRPRVWWHPASTWPMHRSMPDP